MKIIFVDNLLLPEKDDLNNLDLHPHLGLLSLVAVCKNAGYKATIEDPKKYIVGGELEYDASLYEKFASILLAKKPDAIGFTTLGCSFIFALSVSEILKKRNPDIPILLGGPHATILHRKLIERFHFFDVIVRNEAENTIIPVLKGLKNRDFSNIPGITWRLKDMVFENEGNPTVTNVDDLIFPAYHSYGLKELNLNYIRVDAGRGCPFKCTFCSTASFFGRNYRLKSPEKLIAELDELNSVYGYTDFKLNHDLFTVNRKKVLAFCEAINGKGYTWGVSARVDCVDEEMLKIMWEAGCRGIYFGLETGSERMQKISKKKLDISLVEPILNITEQLGMRTIVSFIVGYPEEEETDQNDTLDMLGLCFKRDRSLFSTQLHMLTPEPGTILDTTYGENMQYDGYITDFNALSLREKDTAVIRSNPDIFMTYYYYPTVLPRKKHIFVVEAYRKFRKCGHSILSYILRFYENSFSLLIRDFEKWFNEHHQGEPDKQHILQFILDRFGENHHVYSLVRYSLITMVNSGHKPNSGTNNENTYFNPFQTYVLAPNAFLFESLHSCSEIIAKIQSDIQSKTQFDNEQFGPQGYHLVITKGENKEGLIENYEINESTFIIASLLQKPVSYKKLISVIQPVVGDNLPDKAMFKELLKIGAIIPSDELSESKYASKNYEYI
jgi:radical SAM superfamily enzyme YgiQ (UPF0313 family)